MSRPAVLLLAALLLTGSVAAHAQDESGESTGPVLYDLELAPKDDFPNGKAAYLEAEADTEGQRYQLGGTELDQPILVSVLTRDPSDKVRVRIVKDEWEKPDRDESTEGAKRLDLAFRTFDGFKVWVTADEPTDYQLIVWAGDAMDLTPPPIAQPASTFVQKPGVVDAQGETNADARGGPSLSWLELVLGGALLLVVAGLVMFVLMRRKPAKGASP